MTHCSFFGGTERPEKLAGIQGREQEGIGIRVVFKDLEGSLFMFGEPYRVHQSHFFRRQNQRKVNPIGFTYLKMTPIFFWPNHAPLGVL